MHETWLVTLLILVSQVSAQNIHVEINQNIVMGDAKEPDGNCDPGHNDSLKLTDGSLCYRNCSESSGPLTCYWAFVIQDYYTMSSACSNCSHDIQDCSLPECIAADGVPRYIISVNREIPGPAVEVCKGDRVIFDVYNGQLSDSATIHWHGQLMKGYQFYDGAPLVTQWPIVGYGPFRYDFVADTVGTTFWHSHRGLHRSYGIYGSFIVRQEHDPSAALYDVDNNTLILQDWFHNPIMAPFIGSMYVPPVMLPADTILVNGKGRNTTVGEMWPIEVVKVTQGMRYRLRIIFAGVSDCPIIVSVDNHTMLLIAADAHDIIPEPVDSFIINIAQRYDVVIDANQSIDNYWIRFNGIVNCSINSCVQGAILRYDGASDDYPSADLNYNPDPPGRVLDPFVTVGNETVLTIMELNSSEPYTLPEHVDKRFNLVFKGQEFPEPFPEGPGRRAFPQINGVTFKFPSSPPMVQPDDPQPTICKALDEDGSVDPKFCYDTFFDGRNGTFCNCTYVFEVDLGDWVEMVLTRNGTNHPFHLHGYYFSVVAMGNFSNDGSVPEDIELKLENAVFKDTVTIPKGYTIIRFKADNPGWWLLHCHILPHSEKGMMAILRVGKQTDLQIPTGFPQMTKYKPPY